MRRWELLSGKTVFLLVFYLVAIPTLIVIRWAGLMPQSITFNETQQNAIFSAFVILEGVLILKTLTKLPLILSIVVAASLRIPVVVFIPTHVYTFEMLFILTLPALINKDATESLRHNVTYMFCVMLYYLAFVQGASSWPPPCPAWGKLGKPDYYLMLILFLLNRGRLRNMVNLLGERALAFVRRKHGNAD